MLVLAQSVAAPFRDVEGQIGEDVVRLRVRVQVIVDGIGVPWPEIALDPANRRVHLRQTPEPEQGA